MDTPATPQPRYGIPARRPPTHQPTGNEQYAAPMQGSPAWSDVEKLVNKAVHYRLQTLAPALEWTQTQGEPIRDEQYVYENNLCWLCNEPGHRKFECPNGGKGGKGGKFKGGKGGKGGKGKGGKGEPQTYTATPPPLYVGQPTPSADPPPAHAAIQDAYKAGSPWPCERCNDGSSHNLSACPSYKGCENCSSKQHLQRRCRAAMHMLANSPDNLDHNGLPTLHLPTTGTATYVDQRYIICRETTLPVEGREDHAGCTDTAER